MINTVKITSNGQITLPRKIRDILNTNSVSFEITEDNDILIKPVHSVAGFLKSYSKNINFEEAREKAWYGVIDDWKK